MTEEKIEQKMNNALDKRMGTICYLKKDNVQIPYTDGYKDGYTECEAEKDKQIEELKAQITELDRASKKNLIGRITELEQRNSNQAESITSYEGDIQKYREENEKLKNKIEAQIEKMKCFLDNYLAWYYKNKYSINDLAIEAEEILDELKGGKL